MDDEDDYEYLPPPEDPPFGIPRTVYEWRRYLAEHAGGDPDDFEHVLVVNGDEPMSIIVAIPPDWDQELVEGLCEDIRPVNCIVSVVPKPW
jgi:hypothetical protein